jgi:hypothetical protein
MRIACLKSGYHVIDAYALKPQLTHSYLPLPSLTMRIHRHEKTS